MPGYADSTVYNLLRTVADMPTYVFIYQFISILVTMGFIYVLHQNGVHCIVYKGFVYDHQQLPDVHLCGYYVM